MKLRKLNSCQPQYSRVEKKPMRKKSHIKRMYEQPKIYSECDINRNSLLDIKLMDFPFAGVIYSFYAFNAKTDFVEVTTTGTLNGVVFV